jgi:drug/metabolite transporter (DMT)-like permease
MDKRERAVAFTLASSFLWGSSFVVVGYGVGVVDPMLFLALRFAIAVPIAIVVWPFRRAIRNRTVWLLGAFNAAAFVLQYAALGLTSATNVALLISMDLVFVGLAAVYFLGEKATWRLAAYLGAGLSGAMLVEAGSAGISVQNLMGDMMALGAAVSWAAYIILSKKALTGEGALSAEELTAGVCIATTVPLLAMTPFFGSTGGINWLTALVLSSYLAIFTTVLAYVLWYKGLESLPASTTSILLMTSVAFSAVLAYVFLDERPGPWTLVGGALIGLAALLAATGK